MFVRRLHFEGGRFVLQALLSVYYQSLFHTSAMSILYTELHLFKSNALVIAATIERL